MASRQPGVPALEASGPLGKTFLPIRIHRWASSYDDALKDPALMTLPLSKMGTVPWKPQYLTKVEQDEASLSSPAMTLSLAIDSVDKVPVVKAKLPMKAFQHFGDAGYIPHRGLTTKETNYLTVAETQHKLKLQSGQITKEERQPVSAHTTLHSSPKQKPRGWFTSGSSTALPGPNPSTMDSGSGDKDRNLSDKWSLFGPRCLQKYDSGSFATQKPSPMELIHAQLPKMNILVMEGKKQPPWTHKLKLPDLNVLTPTGF
uniref:Putative monooxygenase p33MONOX n=1 Tax=Rhinopithecus roxellana TaxID=61622 RepID=A0A2K6PAD1_RHIRO